MKEWIMTACILLVGVLSLACGFFVHNKLLFWSGIAVVAAGVLTGVVRIVSQEDSRQRRRS